MDTRTVRARDDESGTIARLALALTDFTERWVPDAFIFALLATVVVVLAGVFATRATLPEVIDAWGRGFWDLIPFTLQMALIVITGHVLAISPPMGRLIRRVAGWPRTGRGAVALVTLFGLASAYINWGFSLAFTAILAREVARRVERVDYRALAAASFAGVGSIWAQGLSGSAALQMATPGALQPQIRDLVAHGGLVPGGIISFAHTIFLWQSVASVIVETAVVTAVMWFATPQGARVRTARDLGVQLGEDESQAKVAKERRTPGAWLEYSPILSWTIVAIGLTYLVRYFMGAGGILNAINLNILNLTFLLIAFLLHRTPARLMHAVRMATPSTWGILLQFPFYAGIAGIITATQLNARLAEVFVKLSTPVTFPALVALYSAFLGVFVPSGGSKWVILAPYVMSAAHSLHVHLGWVVSTYDLGEAVANLIQPFFMLPMLAIMRLGARDVMGYTTVIFLALLPVVLVLVTALGATLGYPL